MELMTSYTGVDVGVGAVVVVAVTSGCVAAVVGGGCVVAAGVWTTDARCCECGCMACVCVATDATIRDDGCVATAIVRAVAARNGGGSSVS